MKNVFYFRVLNKIGGIETFFYYLAKKYTDWDITVYYSSGDAEQIKRLRKYIRVKQYNGEKIKCNRIFFNFNLDIINNVEADEYIQIAHGDYKAMGIKPNTSEKLTKYLGVSKQVCQTYKEVTGVETELVYNPIEIDEPKKVLRLISATRLTKEKGKERIIKLAEILNKNNIPYIWTIFTDDIKVISNPNIIYMRPRLDIINYIADSDYLVQLSDNEGYCYSVIESLIVGTPVIVTKCPVFKELGVVNNKNGYILDFDMENIPINDIYTKIPKFEYNPPKDNWENLLVKGKSNYEEEQRMKYLVEATEKYEKTNTSDSELSIKCEKRYIPQKGERWEVNFDRKELLVEKGFVTVVKEVKEVETATKKTNTEKAVKKTAKKDK